LKTLKELLGTRRLLISDGAFGTELARLGLPPGQCAEKWNADHPAEVRAVCSGYVAAGSDIILTNTFGGSPLKLAKSGLDRETHELNRAGAALAKEAAAGKALVFGSIGPTGEFMEPLGTMGEEQMVECFARQVKGLVAGGVDGFVIETFSDIAEARAVLRAIGENSDAPAVVSFTFAGGPGGYATMMGVRPGAFAEAFEAAGAAMVGSNCGTGIGDMIEIAKQLRTATRLPLWIKPNAGLPELVGGKTVFHETPAQMAGRLSELVAAGAAVVGGCCGTTPEHVRQLAAERRRLGL